MCYLEYCKNKSFSVIPINQFLETSPSFYALRDTTMGHLCITNSDNFWEFVELFTLMWHKNTLTSVLLREDPFIAEKTCFDSFFLGGGLLLDIEEKIHQQRNSICSMFRQLLTSSQTRWSFWPLRRFPQVYISYVYSCMASLFSIVSDAKQENDETWEPRAKLQSSSSPAREPFSQRDGEIQDWN